MSKEGRVQGFPDLGSKLAAPAKKSVFERQKAEAEAKRLKEQRETAAVYQDFVRSFDDGGSDEEGGVPASQTDFGRSSGQGSGLPRRHFSSNVPGAGRGSRLSGPGSLGPAPAAFSRKRNHEGSPPVGSSGSTMRAFEDGGIRKGFQLSDDEDEKASSRAEERAKQKPTVHMSSLPPGISTTAIRAVLPSTLNIDGVRILPVRTGAQERRSVSAIVTLASDTPASDLDTAVSSLQNRYLGRGFYLSISRHLSSAVVGSSLPTAANTSLPFGAKPIPSMGRGQLPVRGRGGFAPPPSLTHRGIQQDRGPTDVQVNVVPPSNLKQLKLIHKMLELVMTHGPEFEALLMSRPEVQSEERWAWLWDPSSAGGIWYRWRLWEILTQGRERVKNAQSSDAMQYIFDKGAPWVAQDRNLAFEYTTEMQEFISDSDYDSSEDEDSGDEGRRRLQHLQGGALPSEQQAPTGVDEGPSYLNPLHKAKLVHLLSRLPETSSKLRRGDVARVTAFAIQHAGTGAEEVVDLLTANIHEPFAMAAQKEDSSGREQDDGHDGLDTRDSDGTDPSSYKLVALFVISDILSSSSTSGVRHAWRYRQLFETSLKKKRTFEHLGRLEKQLKWGRLRAEKWRRAVVSILNLWEGWSVFTSTAQEEFLEVFQNPPLTAAEKELAAKAEAEAEKAEKAKSRWKAVTEASGEDAAARDEEMEMDLDGEPMEEDLDGVPMEDSDEDLNGQPMDEDEDAHSAKPDDPASAPEPTQGASPEEAQAVRKSRPRAADMFGDSDDE